MTALGLQPRLMSNVRRLQLRTRLFSTFAVGWALLAGSAADSTAQPALGCLSFDRIECGCSVRLAQPACPAQGTSRFHLHSGPTDGSPLWLVLGGREVELRSKRPLSDTFSFSKGDSWSESYASPGLAVTISYRPGTSTCPKTAPEEPCSYFDVNAQVTIESAGQQFIFRGSGICGC